MSPNLHRNVWSLMGLPIDLLDKQSAIKEVLQAVENRQHLFVSTPNQNFVANSLIDSEFRLSIINSDMSLADGMPLVWVANLLGVPLKERVSGSGLIEALMVSQECLKRPVKVFFFGGQEGVAEMAFKRLQTDACGLIGVGSYYPGFGTVEEMSQKHVIDTINASDADFIIVSLGARKGQEWIVKNRHKLEAPVISHLGAVVNFVAGTSKRAPKFFQKTGLEWLWRIKEEPKLFKRYFFDGLVLMRLCLTKIAPLVFISFKYRRRLENPVAKVLLTNVDETMQISIEGVVTHKNLSEVKKILNEYSERTPISMDISGLEFADASFFGLLLLIYQVSGGKLEIQEPSNPARKLFKYNCLDFLL